MKDGRFFLDTNILLYTFDKTAPHKQAIANDLVEQALLGKGCISFQVMQEFLNTALRKFEPPMTTEQAQSYLQTTLQWLCDYYPSEDFYQRGLGIKERWRFSWYDSLIITAALECGCHTLYSEDLQHQQKVETLTILNPFMG